MPKIVGVDFQDDFILALDLDDGKHIDYDLKPKLNTLRFMEINDIEQFKRGRLIDHRVIVWSKVLELTLEEIRYNL